MIAHRNFEHCEPLTWVGRMPVYLATVLAGVHLLTMIFTAFAMAASPMWAFATFGFSPSAALKELHLWQFVTYAFVNPPGFWALIQLVLLAIYGGEVEKFLGRASFALLYGVQVLAIPVFLTAIGFFGWARPFAGSDEINIAVFVAFVLLYPSAGLSFGIFSVQAKWVCIAVLGVLSLQMIASADLVRLSVLWLECAVVAAWLIWAGVPLLPWRPFPANPRPKGAQKKFRVVPREELEEDPPVHESVDPILEKIARQGIGSLTRGERERLERARATLLKKESDK